MQDWHFDDLTRTLGKATSRRQVFKGLLSGLGLALVGRAATAAPTSAAPGGGCDAKHCEVQAVKDLMTCNSSCSSTVCKPTVGGPGLPNPCFGCYATCYGNFRIALHECRTTGCSGAESCCGQTCTDLRSDARNCGACGHACQQGESCSGGECQCADDRTNCNGTCVDTQSDKNNCGSCGNVCSTCQDCVTGQCVNIECADGQTCCNNNCVPLCLNGDQPDPTTCQCNICKGQIDGAACDANDNTKLCCEQQCVSNTCPQGKTFSLDTCSCQCSTSCPPDQLQDPDTCQCQDLCADVTCPECQTCDPTSGTRVQADDQTPCGTNQVCCSGTCQDTCGTCPGLPCSNGDCCDNNTDWACCQDGCCPQVTIQEQTGAWCVAPGPVTDPLGGPPTGNCCEPSHLVKGRYLNDQGQCDCSDGLFEVWCDNNLGSDLVGTRCSCGYWES